MNRVYLALGSNIRGKPSLLSPLGRSRERFLLQAIGLISKHIGAITALSSVYETKPQGFESENDFLNMVICVNTELSPHDLLTTILKIEKKMGRTKKTKPETFAYFDRVIDIDIIAYNDLVLESENLTLPHPRFHQRQFVLNPFIEIAPDYIHPVLNRKIKELPSLLRSCPQK